MAFETNLPANSERYSQTLWKDPNDRIWTGKTGEYYRFLDPADMPYINIKDFGAVGDGMTDDTDAWDEALTVAKAMEMPLFIPAGKYPVTVDVDTIDMNGCTGLTGIGELLMTSNGAPDEPIMEWQGTKSRIASNLNVTAGQNTFTVDTGLDIKKGDTIFLISNQPFYTDMSASRYVRGNRLTVDSYDSVTGDLLTSEYVSFDVTAAYLYHNNYRPRVFIDGVTISLQGDLDKKGLEFTASEVIIRGLKMNNFGRFGINISSSFGRVSDTQIHTEFITGTGTGYSLQCSGLSDIIGFNSNFYGARHGVACGDVGYWRTGDVDEAGDDPIFAPPIVKLTGCRIEGREQALDSHAGTILLDVYNTDIYGGCIIAALESFLTGCRIYQGPAGAAIRLGRDRTTDSGQAQSKHSIRNCEVYASSQFLLIANDMERVELNNINVYATATATARTFMALSSNTKVRNWVIRGLNHIGNTGDNVTYNFYLVSPLVIESCNFEYARMVLSAREAGAGEMYVKDTRVLIESGVGIATGFSGASGANKLYSLNLAGVTVTGGAYAVSINGAKRLIASGCILKGSTTSSVNVVSTAGGDVDMVLQTNTIDQASGNVINAGQTTNVVLIGNVFVSANAFSANAVILGKYGNIGLNDKLKTSLTSASTDKYGADGTTGDLTLS